MRLKQSIERLIQKQPLDQLICQGVMEEIINEKANPLQIAAFLVLLRSKPETVEEMADLMFVLKKKMVTLSTPYPVLDIVGTGGDGAGTINISTGSAILAASCGIKIAKHGNRAVSSQSGSADVLEALGLNIDLPSERVSQCIDKMGIGFCFSPNYHPAMMKLRSIRRQLNIPSTFNLMGPLLNPAGACHFLLGVLDKKLLPIMAELLMRLGAKKSMVVHGNGLDELSTAGKTHVFEVTQQGIESYVIDPAKFGFSYCCVSDLKGADAQTNAKLLLDVFSGKPGPIADTLMLNAAVALYLYGNYPSIEAALLPVKESLCNKMALKLLNNWIGFSHESA